jgi:L-threonylcarbamoyladenylate synthase
MRLISKNEKSFSGDFINEISQALKMGKIAILPTSTIYGISCVYNNRRSIEKVYEIKKRKKNLPFIILVPDTGFLCELAEEVNKTADMMIKRFWLSDNPEPVTLLFKKNKKIGNYITSGSDKIAIRMDTLHILKEIIYIAGPIISTSATVSGDKNISPKNIAEVPDIIRTGVDIVLDLEKDLPGISSTIIDVSSSKPVIIREGIVKKEDLKDFL